MLGSGSVASTMSYEPDSAESEEAKKRKAKIKQRYKLASFSASLRHTSNPWQKVPPVVNLKVLVEERIRKLKDNTFVYLNYTVPKSSEHFTPYSLA